MTNVFSLTQIRHLMRVEFGRAQRYGYPLSCLVLSCDRLDQLRDVHGVEFKEGVVEGIVELLIAETRTCDYLGRLVDDRLLAILPHTTPEGADALARRVLASVRAATFRAGGEAVPVSLSVGIADFAEDSTLFFDSLVSFAEDALNQALQAGGDRFVHAGVGELPAAPEERP